LFYRLRGEFFGDWEFKVDNCHFVDEWLHIFYCFIMFLRRLESYCFRIVFIKITIDGLNERRSW